jgi:hypothetical protein
MPKLDLKKQLKDLYTPSSKSPAFVEVPAMNFLMIDGHGDPNTSADYREAVGALYSVTYTIKFMVKKQPDGLDYPVMPLEGLWWVADMSQFSEGHKEDWDWTMMIMQPDLVNQQLFAEGLAAAGRKKPSPMLQKMRLECYDEGLCAQIMHIGPYAAEKPTIENLHHFSAEKGYQRRGKHHEIYLKDPGRTAPEKLLTIIRQPVRK